jgi:hypothetical protein
MSSVYRADATSDADIFAEGSTAADKRDVRLRQIYTDHDDAVEFLLNVAKSPAKGKERELAKCSAIQLMGKLRVARAAAFLIDEIEYTSFWAKGHSEVHPLLGFAAAKSLAEIGEPAIEAIFARSSNPLSEKQMRLIAFTINSIYQDQEIAQFRLQHRINALRKDSVGNETDPRLVNLTKLLTTFNSIDFQDQQEWPCYLYLIPVTGNSGQDDAF